MPGMTTLSTT